MTDKKQTSTLILFVLTILLMEGWQFFRYANFNVDAFLYYTDRQGGNSLHIVWFAKDLGNKLGAICFAFIPLRLARLWFTVRVAAGGFLFYTVADLFLFFWCYNTCSYVPVILSTVVFTLCYWYYRKYGIKLSRKQKAQASVARKDDSSTKVKYIKNYEAEVHLSD